jgi:hypothetical protein
VPVDAAEGGLLAATAEDAADATRLCAWFETGALVRPDHAAPNFLDLVRAIAHLAGARPPGAAEAGAKRLAALIGPADHYVFILVDGLGAGFLDFLPPDAFLRVNQVESLLAVFPSTTAVALTSLATAAWPATHGIYGWWVRFPEINATGTVLPYVERFSEQPLEALGLKPEQAFPLPSIVPAFTHAPLAILPDSLAAGVYSRYATGDTARHGYKDIREAVRAARERVAKAREPTYTYLYLPQLDSMCHSRGIDPARAGKLLATIDRELAELRARLPASARLVLSADHGLVSVPPERQFALGTPDPLLGCLRNEPVGDLAVPCFHVKPGAHARFARMFRERFGATHVLLPIVEVQRLGLLGPEPLAPVTRARIGDFVALSEKPALLYHAPDMMHPDIIPAAHSGLTKDEMLIPLCLA